MDTVALWPLYVVLDLFVLPKIFWWWILLLFCEFNLNLGQTKHLIGGLRTCDGHFQCFLTFEAKQLII